MFSSTSSSATNLENLSGVSSFTPHTFSTHISLKLDDDNFLLWQQVTAIVHGLNLSRFLEDSSSPSEFLTAENSESPTHTLFFFGINNKITFSLSGFLSPWQRQS